LKSKLFLLIFNSNCGRWVKKDPQKKEKQKNYSTEQIVTNTVPDEHTESNNKNQFGLTVRIEINLPAEGDQETYNRIFKSICLFR